MKYLLLIHSNPEPWGHPTQEFLAAHRALPDETRTQLNDEFESGLIEMMARGEFVSAEPLADPTTSRLFRWTEGNRIVTDGPYAEGKEHLAGFFLIDVDTAERAEEIALRFSGPGETVELRPVMSSQ